MASNSEAGFDWTWYEQYNRERQEWVATYQELTLPELVGLAEDSYPKVGVIDMVVDELARRKLGNEDEAMNKVLEENILCLELLRKEMSDFLCSDNPVAGQEVSAEIVEFTDETGQERHFYFTAFELAKTGQLTSEQKIQAALRQYGIVASIRTKEVSEDGITTSKWTGRSIASATPEITE